MNARAGYAVTRGCGSSDKYGTRIITAVQAIMLSAVKTPYGSLIMK